MDTRGRHRPMRDQNFADDQQLFQQFRAFVQSCAAVGKIETAAGYSITWVTTEESAGVAHVVSADRQREAAVILLNCTKSAGDTRTLLVARGMLGNFPEIGLKAISQAQRPVEIIVLREIEMYNDKIFNTIIHNFSRGFFATERPDNRFQKMLAARGAVQVNGLRDHLGLTESENEFALKLSEKFQTELEVVYVEQRESQKLRPVVFSGVAGMLLVSSQAMESLYSRRDQ